jgi:DNA polymerase III alpha subunit
VEVAPPEEFSTAPGGVLVLLAMDLTGWSSLCRLASALSGDDDRLPFKRLAQETYGLICLTGGRGGSLAGMLSCGQTRLAFAWLKRLSHLFSNRLYVELPYHTGDEQPLVNGMAALADRMSLDRRSSGCITCYRNTPILAPGGAVRAPDPDLSCRRLPWLNSSGHSGRDS